MPNVLIYRPVPMPSGGRLALVRDRRARARVWGTPWWIVLAVLLACLFLAAADVAGSQGAGQKTNPFEGNAEAISEGQALYVRNGCSGCHGLKGGGGMAVALTDDTWKFGDSDEILFKLIKGEIPESTMPKLWQSLEPDQVWKMIAYIRSLRTDAEKGGR